MEEESKSEWRKKPEGQKKRGSQEQVGGGYRKEIEDLRWPIKLPGVTSNPPRFHLQSSCLSVTWVTHTCPLHPCGQQAMSPPPTATALHRGLCCQSSWLTLSAPMWLFPRAFSAWWGKSVTPSKNNNDNKKKQKATKCGRTMTGIRSSVLGWDPASLQGGSVNADSS